MRLIDAVRFCPAGRHPTRRLDGFEAGALLAVRRVVAGAGDAAFQAMGLVHRDETTWRCVCGRLTGFSSSATNAGVGNDASGPATRAMIPIPAVGGAP